MGQGIRRISAQVPRAQIFISGKVDLNSNEDPAERMGRQIQSSLSALGTDYIDSALIHWPVCLDDPEADHQAVRRGCWKALEQLVCHSVCLSA